MESNQEIAYDYLLGNEQERYSEVLRKAYPDQFFFFFPERLKWLPHLGDDRLPVLTARCGSQTAAWVWLQKSPVFVDGTIINDAFFSVNTFTLAEFRRRGIGVQLQQRAASAHRLFWSISMSSANRRNRQRLGWQDGVPLHEYCLRIGKFDREKLFCGLFDYCRRKRRYVLGGLLRLADLLGGGWLAYRLIDFHFPKWQLGQSKNDLLFREISLYGGEWDVLWGRIRREYRFGVNRDSAWMNWSYVTQPHLRFSRYAVLRDGKWIGTVVFRAFEDGEMPHGIVTELLTEPGENESTYRDILQYAVRKLSERGCQYVYLGLSDKKYEHVLRGIGFRCLGHLVPMYHFQNEAGEPLTLPDGKWLMSLGDQDIAQYVRGRHPSAKQMLKMMWVKNETDHQCR